MRFTYIWMAAHMCRSVSDVQRHNDAILKQVCCYIAGPYRLSASNIKWSPASSVLRKCIRSWNVCWQNGGLYLLTSILGCHVIAYYWRKIILVKCVNVIFSVVLAWIRFAQLLVMFTCAGYCAWLSVMVPACGRPKIQVFPQLERDKANGHD